ncbi:DNA-binding protein RFXANK [Penicillium chrysogenum]|uniref:DNA-binding protein RFXANK n=1 Tax=Penicillium chrysogenum TaxID=5076 RepID=A0A167V896_PENCH|nr:DNA-binding protein RFXANK [Penicillium chrysogenum]
MEVLLPVHGSHKRWTSGYEEIDDLTLRRLLVEVNFALRSIEFELSVREIEPSARSTTTTKSTSENTLVKPPYLKSQKAKERMTRREDKLSVIYGKIQNTADKIKRNGLSNFAVVPGSERAQLLIEALRIIIETSFCIAYLHASSESLVFMQLRDCSAHGTKSKPAICAPLEKQYHDLSILIGVQISEKELTPTPMLQLLKLSFGKLQGKYDGKHDSWLLDGFNSLGAKTTQVQQQCHIIHRDERRRNFPSSNTEAEVHETTTVEDDDDGLEERSNLGSTCSQELNDIHHAFEPKKNEVVSVTCDRSSARLQCNALQMSNENHQLHMSHDQSQINTSSVYNSGSIISPLFDFSGDSAPTFCTGISLEDTFNRNSTLIHERPYDSEIFAVIQDGDVPAAISLLGSGKASIHDVDPYGLGLLYYASYYCWKGHGASKAMHICSWLMSIGVNTRWTDDIGKQVSSTRRVYTPMESMLDSALVHTAMSGGSALEFGKFCEDIGVLFNMTLSEIGMQYLNTRGFSELHQVLLRITHKVSLSDYLRSLERDTLDNFINRTDSRGRTPLTWAVEFGWSDGTQILLDYGADPHRAATTNRGSVTLLHLAVAGPRSQFLRAGFLEVIDILLQMEVDVNARDHEGWTPLHIAASWGIFDLRNLFSQPALDWSVLTNDNMSVDALSPIEQFSNVALARIYQS